MSFEYIDIGIESGKSLSHHTIEFAGAESRLFRIVIEIEGIHDLEGEDFPHDGSLPGTGKREIISSLSIRFELIIGEAKVFQKCKSFFPEERLSFCGQHTAEIGDIRLTHSSQVTSRIELFPQCRFRNDFREVDIMIADFHLPSNLDVPVLRMCEDEIEHEEFIDIVVEKGLDFRFVASYREAILWGKWKRGAHNREIVRKIKIY